MNAEMSLEKISFDSPGFDAGVKLIYCSLTALFYRGISAWRQGCVLRTLALAIVFSGVTDASENGPTLTSEVDFGLLSKQVEFIRLKIPVINRTQETFFIDEIQGSCTCFRTASYSPVVERRAENKIEFKFDVRRFVDSGRWDTMVAVTFRAGDGRLETRGVRLTAKFSEGAEVVLVPPTGQIVLGKNGAGEQREAHVGIFVKRWFLPDVSIEVGDGPEWLGVEIRSNGFERTKYGDFIEAARITFSPRMFANKRKFSEIGIPIELNGAISNTFQYKLDVVR